MPSNRRRQRSVRITVAGLLLVVAGLVVAAAILLAQVLVLAVAAVVALAAGAVAVRLVISELIQSRRDAAADRAGQARSYQTLDARRVDESAEFTSQMTASLDDAKTTVGELHGTLRLAERRAELAEQRARHEARRRGELQNQVDELTTDQSEAAEPDDSEVGDAVPYWDPDVPTVVDLLAWEDRTLDGMDTPRADLA